MLIFEDNFYPLGAARTNFSEGPRGIQAVTCYEAESQVAGLPTQAVTLLQPLDN